jgi:DNA-binding transcriptional MerR regulator
MRKLKIGELSGLVGAPASALRFWEERGITEPEKDSGNNYRLYSAEDSCRFLMARRYRSLGFSLSEAKDMIAGADASDIAERLRRRLAELDAEARRLDAIRDELGRYLDECRAAREGLGVFAPSYLPAARYVFTIEAGELVDDQSAIALSRRWADRLPFSSYSLYLPPEAFLGSMDYRVRWGYSLGDDYLVSEPMGDSPPESHSSVVRLDGAACVFTAFFRDDARNLHPRELSGIVSSFQAAGYAAAGPAIGHLLEVDVEEDRCRYLYSLYIPIK